MIFSIITNTPCIAFDNSNKKISSTYYTWLKNYPLVKFLDSYNKEDILSYVEHFCNTNYQKENISFKNEFEKLVSLLN